MKTYPKMSVSKLAILEDKGDEIAGLVVVLCVPIPDPSPENIPASVKIGQRLAKEFPKLAFEGGETQPQVAEKMAAYLRKCGEFIESHLADFDK